MPSTRKNQADAYNEGRQWNQNHPDAPTSELQRKIEAYRKKWGGGASESFRLGIIGAINTGEEKSN